MSYITLIDKLASFLKTILKFKLLRILVTILAVLYISNEMMIRWTPIPHKIAEWLAVQPDLRKTDVIIVLSGGADQHRKVLEGVTLAREIHGITLWRKGYAPKILFSGGKVSEKYLNDSKYMKKLALDMGVPEEAILVEEKSRNTLENMRFSRKVMEENRLHTALLVTSPLHMKRSLFFAQKFGIDAFPAPSPYWIYAKRGRQLISQMKVEMVGLVIYRYFDEETIRKVSLFVRESFLFDWL